MDVVLLSRLQFASTVIFHFFFVPLTLSLSILIAYMETRFVKTGDETYRTMAKFWGRLFLINFAVGLVTGITLEFQFGTNWAEYSRYVGDVFGSLLAIEATVAFFLESTFIAVWHFGWNKLSPKAHAVSIWLVAIASNISAMWIIAANAWMQNPVGYVIRNGRAELTNFMVLITHSYFIGELLHTLTSAYFLGGFFIMAISGWHILKKKDHDFFAKSFRTGLTFAFVNAILVIALGHLHGGTIARIQPEKLAAMESHWETASSVPMSVLVWPDEENERNYIEAIKIPGLMSFLSFNSFKAEVKGLKDFPSDERPPVLLTFIMFRLMVGLGFYFLLITAYGMLIRNNLEDHPLFLKTVLYSLLLPFLAIQFGWTLAEVGRQPWIVYRVMTTASAASPIHESQVILSFVALTGIYTLLGITDVYLLVKYARMGPEFPASRKGE